MKQSILIKPQRHATTLCKEQGGIVLLSARESLHSCKKSGCTVQKLREWYCNRDLCTHPVWRTRQNHAADTSVPARNENDWSGARHLCPREARQVGWQTRGVIKLSFCGEGFGEDHRSVVGQHVESKDQDYACWTMCAEENGTFPDCVVVWLCGCVVVWLCGCVVVWLCGCVVVWLCGCGLWVVGCGLWVVGCGLWVVGCGLWGCVLCGVACGVRLFSSL